MRFYYQKKVNEPVNNCHFGRYGALVNFTLTKNNENYKPFDLGRQIAQHIVGMKPATIGEADPSLMEKLNNPENPVKIDENETRLIFQEFLMKPNTRVLEFLNENNMIVNDFTRFECGEQVENQ
jgi:translation elongation factor EF-Ts